VRRTWQTPAGILLGSAEVPERYRLAPILRDLGGDPHRAYLLI